MSNYRGSIISLIREAVEKYPEMSVAEVLYSAINKNAIKKHYVEATDEEIYTSFEKLVRKEKETEEQMSEEEFNQWVNKSWKK